MTKRSHLVPWAEPRLLCEVLFVKMVAFLSHK